MNEPNSAETSTENSGLPLREPGQPHGPSSEADSSPAASTDHRGSQSADSGSELSASNPSDASKAEDPDLPDVKAAMEGSIQHFELLVLRHQDRIYTHIFFMVHHRETASDLTQETFFRAYRGLASFRAQARFLSWLKKIAVNTCLHHFEKAKAKKRSGKTISLSGSRFASDGENPADIQIADSSRNPQESAIGNEEKDQILQAVSELPTEYRLCLSLRELEGYSYQEIADQLGIAIGTVKSKIFRARQLLQESLKGLME